jgi:hypothetical protein
MARLRLVRSFRFNRGATQLRFLDVLTAIVLLGVLFYAASLEFKTYDRPPAGQVPVASSAPTHNP